MVIVKRDSNFLLKQIPVLSLCSFATFVPGNERQVEVRSDYANSAEHFVPACQAKVKVRLELGLGLG